MTDTLRAPNPDALPHWDVSVVYPSLDSEEFLAGYAATMDEIKSLRSLFDTLNVAKENAVVPIDSALVARFESILGSFNRTSEAVGILGAYISSFVATNSRNARAQALMSEFRSETVALGVLGTRLTAWIGSLDVEGITKVSQTARDHAHFLHKAQSTSAHLLPPGEEELAAKLNISGSSAWAK